MGRLMLPQRQLGPGHCAAKKCGVVGSCFIRSAAQQSATVQAAEKEALSIGGGQLGPWGVLDGFRLNHELTSNLSLTHTATSAACNVHLTFHKDRSICLKVNIPNNCIFIDANGGNELPQFPTYLTCLVITHKPCHVWKYGWHWCVLTCRSQTRVDQVRSRLRGCS